MVDDIWNTTCPVCGSHVPDGMPLVELSATGGRGYQAQAEQPGLRLCSKECAAVAQDAPAKYRAIAFANRAIESAQNPRPATQDVHVQSGSAR